MVYAYACSPSAQAPLLARCAMPTRVAIREPPGKDAPRSSGYVVLIVEGLPRSGPFKHDPGRRTIELAHQVARRALDGEITGGGLALPRCAG